MRVRLIAALCGAALLAGGVRAAEDRKPPSKTQECDNLGKLLVDICQLDGQDGRECVQEDMQKAGFVDGKDYTIVKNKLVCK